MKFINTLKGSFFFAGALWACAGFAKDWWFDVSMYLADPKSVNWTQSGGDAETDGYWMDSDGVHVRGQLPTAEDSIYITGNDIPFKAEMLVVNEPLTLANIFLGGAEGKADYVAYVKASSFGTKLNITGNVERMLGASAGYLYGYELEVQGDVVINGGGHLSLARGSGNPMHSILIHGDLKGVSSSGGAQSGNLYLTANGLIKSRAEADRTFENGLNAPDTVVEGVVKDVRLFSMADSYDSYIKVGGLSGSSSAQREGNTGYASGTSTYIIFANTTDQSASGDVTDKGGNNLWRPDFGKTVYVMNGSAAQVLTSRALGFHGDVKVISGTLRVNFNQNVYAGQYEYNSAYTDSNNRTRVQAWTGSDGAGERTTWSHGDLEMSGGAFGSTEGSDFGSFRFTNIVYKDGEISLKMNSAEQFDSIDLTSYYLKSEVFADGNVSSTSYEKVDGGSISLASDAAAGTKVKFNFEGDLSWLVDSAENDGKGVKIVSWDAGNKTVLVSEDFAANIYAGLDESYMAEFAVGDDGLYVKYVVVPEPSTVAALAGLLALGLAAYRKRR